jgi:hypothetical protein
LNGAAHARGKTFASSLVIAVVTASALSTPVTAEEVDKTLVERIAKEKEDRKACKKLICDIAQKHHSDGADCRLLGRKDMVTR